MALAIPGAVWASDVVKPTDLTTAAKLCAVGTMPNDVWNDFRTILGGILGNNDLINDIDGQIKQNIEDSHEAPVKVEITVVTTDQYKTQYKDDHSPSSQTEAELKEEAADPFDKYAAFTYVTNRMSGGKRSFALRSSAKTAFASERSMAMRQKDLLSMNWSMPNSMAFAHEILNYRG